MSVDHVTWADVEPWFEDLGDWFAIVTEPPRSPSEAPFTSWKLTLTVRSQVYEAREGRRENIEANEAAQVRSDDYTCPRELATRLRELLDILQTASLSSNRDLWTEIVSHEWGPLGVLWDHVDHSFPCLLEQFSLCFVCESTHGHVMWLKTFVDEFFRPMNELTTLPEFRDIMHKLTQFPVYSSVKSLANWYGLQWRRRLSFWMVDTTREPWDPTAAVAFVVWLSETCEMFRWQLCDVLQFEHYLNILHEAFVYPRGLPVSAVSLRICQRRWASTGMGGSMARSIDFHRICPRGVRLSYYQTAGVTSPPYALCVDRVTSDTDEDTIFSQVYTLLTSTSTPLTVGPMSMSNGILSRASLVVLFTTLVAQSGADELRVVLSLRTHGDSWYQLKFKITRLTRARDLVTTVELRLKDHEDCDDPLEIFIMRVTGSSLRQYALTGITLGFEVVFYQTIRHFCPNLRELAIDGQPIDAIAEGTLIRDDVVTTVHTHETLASAADNELIAQLLKTPEVTSSPSSHPIVSRATLGLLSSAFERMQVRSLLVEIESYPHLHVKFSFLEAHRASTTLALRPRYDEGRDEPLEIFLARQLGPHLCKYSIGGVPSGYETAFYEALIVHCPNLTRLATRLPMVSLNEMVETSERLNSWTIRQMDIMLNNDVPLRSLLDALSSRIHPISETLSHVTLKQHIHEPDVTQTILQLLEAVPQMRYPHVFRLHESIILHAIKPTDLEDLSSAGAFNTIVPVDHRKQLAFLSVMAARGLAMERGIAEKVFAFASRKIHHNVAYSPAMYVRDPPYLYVHGAIYYRSVLEEYKNKQVQSQIQ